LNNSSDGKDATKHGRIPRIHSRKIMGSQAKVSEPASSQLTSGAALDEESYELSVALAGRNP